MKNKISMHKQKLIFGLSAHSIHCILLHFAIDFITTHSLPISINNYQHCNSIAFLGCFMAFFIAISCQMQDKMHPKVRAKSCYGEGLFSAGKRKCFQHLRYLTLLFAGGGLLKYVSLWIGPGLFRLVRGSGLYQPGKSAQTDGANVLWQYLCRYLRLVNTHNQYRF